MKTNTDVKNYGSFFLRAAHCAVLLLIIPILYTVTPTLVHADSEKMPNQRLETRLLRMSENLELSVEQQENLREIMEDGDERRQEIMSEYDVDAETMRAFSRKMHELRNSFDDRLSEVLTAKQMETFQSIRKEDRSKEAGVDTEK
jgi:Spy/CpxP family protein refolding chaperone